MLHPKKANIDDMINQDLRLDVVFLSDAVLISRLSCLC
jgi:hypothetical protein